MPKVSSDILCRESGWRTLVTCLCLSLGGIVAMTIGIIGNAQRWSEAWIGIIFAAVLFLFAAFAFLSYRSTLDASNWVLQSNDEKLWLKCSRRWSDREPEKIYVLELNRDEIEWVQPLRLHTLEDERGKGLSQGGPPVSGIAHQWHSFLEIGLVPSAATTFDHAVNDAKVSKEVRELICPASYTLEQPVQRMEDGPIRVRWGDLISNVTPRIEEVSNSLSSWVEVRPMRNETLRLFFDRDSS